MGYAFLDIEIEPDRREVYRAGERLPIEPKVFDVLVYLIRNRDRLVPKEELLERFWPDEHVYDGALNVCIHRCRRITGAGEKAEVIRTHPGRGYRFIAPIEERKEPAPVTLAPDIPAALIGRVPERKRLQAALQAVLKGDRRVVMIQGGAGIGKTALMAAASQEARRGGFDVLWARASEDTTRTPFPVWTELLNAYAAWHDRDYLRERLGADTALVARLSPGLAARLRLPKSLPASADLQDRTRLFAAVARLLAPSPGAKPLALFLDGLQDAGLASLRLLEEVAIARVDGPLLVVVTFRDADSSHRVDAAEIQAMLRRDWVDEALRLGPLSDTELREVIHRHAGRPVADELLAAVIDCAEGTPAVAIEHWYQLVGSGVAVAEPDRWTCRGDPNAIQPPVNRSILLARRVNSFAKDTRSVLDAASVTGTVFDASLLAQVLRRSADAIDKALQEAMEARIVVRLRSSRGRWRFAHGLVRDFLYAQLSDELRSHLHRQTGEALLSRKGDGNDSWLPLIAQHLLDGATAETAGDAIAMAYRAGTYAFGVLAFEKAIDIFEQALALMDAFQPAVTVERWHILFGLAEAHTMTGDLDRARASLREMSADESPEVSSETTPTELPVESTRLLSVIQFALQPHAQDGTAMAQMAITELGRNHRAAADAARARRDLRGVLVALLSRRWSLSAGPDARERLAISTEARLIADRVGNPRWRREATLLLINDLYETVQIAAAEREIEAFQQLAKDQPDAVGNWVAAYLPATRALLAGRFTEAQQLAQQAVFAGGMTVNEVGLAAFGAQVNASLTIQGHSEELALILEGFIQQYPHLPIGHATLARAYVETGRLEEARRELDIVSGMEICDHPITGVLGANATAGLARVCERLGDRGAAEKYYEQLLPWRANCVMVPPAVVCLGSTTPHLAVFAAAAGRWREALDLFEESLEIHTRIGARAVIAQTQYELARLLLQRRSRTARERARALLAEAREIARELDMTGVLRWIESLAAESA